MCVCVCVCRAVEKLDVKDDRVHALENEHREIQQKIDAQQQEFAQRQELLKSDHETLLAVVSRYHRHSAEVLFLVWLL